MSRRTGALIGVAVGVMVVTALALVVTEHSVLVGQSVRREDGETWMVCRYFDGASVYERYGRYSPTGWKALVLPDVEDPRPPLASCPLLAWDFVIVD